MAGISSKALNFGTPESKNKYNGIEKENDLSIEIYDAQLRELDGQIGVWWQIDPKTENMEMWSPYVSNYDNPIRYSDPLGDEGQECCQTGLLNWIPKLIGRMVDNLDNNIGLATDVKNKAVENATNRLDARATYFHQAIDDPFSFIPDEPLSLLGGPAKQFNFLNGAISTEKTLLKVELNAGVKAQINVVKAEGKQAASPVVNNVKAQTALPHSKAIKSIVKNASKPNVVLSDSKIAQLERVVKKSGGTVRTEVGTTGTVKGIKHSHVEGYGTKTSSRHIIHQNQN